jgi:SPX domain protein involved in polyphosphate accumulation
MGHSARYERKYLIQESRALAIADYLSSYLRPSAHNNTGPVRGHPVISLYMDTPDFFFFRQAYTGHLNRMKLRIRFYDDQWKRPAFLEVKRRVHEVICKDRAMMTREGVRQILTQGLTGQPFWPDIAHMMHGRRRQDVSDDFWNYANISNARGAVYISYIREIWEAPDDEELRVTFDREIHGSYYDGSGELHVPKRGWRPYLPPYLAPMPHDGVVLELKYDTRAPRWMCDLVRTFNLNQIAICKYTSCIYAQQLHVRPRILPELEQDLIGATWKD